METIEESAKGAAECARRRVLAALKRHGITLSLVARRLREELDATEIRAHWDRDAGQWQYSAELVSHGARSRALELAIALLEMRPAESICVSGDVALTHELHPDLAEMIADIRGGGRNDAQ